MKNNPTRKLLEDIDPPAVSCMGDYLERPDSGWVLFDDYFVGIGYQGNTMACYKEKWQPAKGGLGHIPTNGYG